MPLSVGALVVPLGGPIGPHTVVSSATVACADATVISANLRSAPRRSEPSSTTFRMVDPDQSVSRRQLAARVTLVPVVRERSDDRRSVPKMVAPSRLAPPKSRCGSSAARMTAPTSCASRKSGVDDLSFVPVCWPFSHHDALAASATATSESPVSVHGDRRSLTTADPRCPTRGHRVTAS
jgi:hypothetical protein